MLSEVWIEYQQKALRYHGRDAPNKRRNKIEFSRDGLIPFPCWQVSKPEPLNFLRKKGLFRSSTRTALTHADFLARLCFKLKVFGDTGNNKERDVLFSNFRLDDTFRVYFSSEIVTRFFRNLNKMS